MKIRQLFYTAWLGIALSVRVMAQEPLWIDLQPTHQLHPFSTSDPGFYISRVIDARPGYTRSNFVQRGNTHVSVQLSFQGGLEHQLQSFFVRLLPATESKLPVLVKVNRLCVGEYATTLEMGTAAVALDFLSEQNDGYCLLFRAFAFVKAEGVDVEKLHAPNLVRALTVCLQQFQESNWQTIFTRKDACTAEQLTASAKWATDTAIPVVQAKAPAQGMYQTFLEFRNNTASQTIPLLVREQPHLGSRKSKITLYQQFPDRGQEEVEDAWGFSDGKQAYIYFQNDYFPLRPVEGGFVFDAYPMPEAYMGGATATAGVKSGMLDGGVTGTLTGLFTLNRRQSYFLDIYTGQITVWYPARLSLPETPVVASATKAEWTTLTIYYRTTKKTPSTSVHIVFSNGIQTVMRELQPGGFVQLPWKNLTSEITVCIQESLSPCYTFVSGTATHYLEYVPVDSKEDIAIRSVKSREALFYLTPMGYETTATGNKANPTNE